MGSVHFNVPYNIVFESLIIRNVDLVHPDRPCLLTKSDSSDRKCKVVEDQGGKEDTCNQCTSVIAMSTVKRLLLCHFKSLWINVN